MNTLNYLLINSTSLLFHSMRYITPNETGNTIPQKRLSDCVGYHKYEQNNFNCAKTNLIS